jgi:hypothetical protein
MSSRTHWRWLAFEPSGRQVLLLAIAVAALWVVGIIAPDEPAAEDEWSSVAQQTMRSSLNTAVPARSSPATGDRTR